MTQRVRGSCKLSDHRPTELQTFRQVRGGAFAPSAHPRRQRIAELDLIRGLRKHVQSVGRYGAESLCTSSVKSGDTGKRECSRSGIDCTVVSEPHSKRCSARAEYSSTTPATE
ncbi:hypothetical protein Efla_007566 [Eimeria flavescens]